MSKFFNKKILAIIILVIVVATGLNFGFNSFFPNKPNENAKASELSANQKDGNEAKNLTPEEEIKKKVRDNPDAGLEAIDSSTLDKTKFFMKTLPRGFIENELKNQLKDGYITQKQYDQFIELLDKKDRGEQI